MALRSLGKSMRDRLGPAVYPAVRALLRPPRRIYRHLPYFGIFSLEVDPGVRIRLRAKGQIVENELFWRGFAKSWESESLLIWRDRVREARTIVDVGANSGIFALVAKAITPGARVIALEPSASVAKLLRENVALNDLHITVEEVAASDRAGEVTFYDFESEHQYSASIERGMGGTVERTVKAVRLDDLIEGPVDLVKIDVEMHEPAVLRGMRRILERNRPTMLVEILTEEVRRGVEAALDGIPYRWTKIEDGEAWTNYLLEPVTPAP